MLANWLKELICKSACELEASGKTIFQFGLSVTKALEKNPVQDWEADRWSRGLKGGLIRLEGHFFRVGSGKRSSLSFFVRNDRDLYVGLRRESITQAATFVTLVTDYGYPRARTRFESRWMDVAVYGENRKALIYAETKSSEKTLQKLCARLSIEFSENISLAVVPRGIWRGTHQVINNNEGSRPATCREEVSKVLVNDDALMKACHIWRHRPRYFWGVSPTHRQAYQVVYHSSGFLLSPSDSLPAAQ